MINRRVRRRKRHIRDEETSSHHPAKPRQDRFGLMALQRQVGNRAIQQMITQRQTAEQEQQAEAANVPVEAGQVKIEKPEIEEYEVNGNSLAEVAGQVLPPEQWYEYEYQYNSKVENGVVTQVEVIVKTKIHLPRWVGASWEHATEVDKLAWLELLNRLVGDNEEYDDMGQVPRQWVGIDWETAPPALKNEWQGMLQELHSNEQTRLDIILRRVLILQQRLLNRPEDQINAIFDQFQQDLEVEEEAYNKQRAFGQDEKIILGTDVMIQ